jgi:hypothetical protein
MTKSKGIYERHGKRHTSAYGVWCSMLDRCTNPNNPAYKNYGQRGIGLSDRWGWFSSFYADMGDPPPGMTLERLDNNKGYSKENCIWADRKAQGRNKRNNVMITLDGETHPLSVWAERTGLKYATVHQRIRKGWTPEAAIKTPLITVRKGIPRGQKLHAFGANHGVVFHDGGAA